MEKLICNKCGSHDVKIKISQNDVFFNPSKLSLKKLKKLENILLYPNGIVKIVVMMIL